MPWSHRVIGNPILSGLTRLFFGTHITDTHCGLRGISTEAYHQLELRSPGMEFATEMVAGAARMGLRTAEVPVGLLHGPLRHRGQTPDPHDQQMDLVGHLTEMPLQRLVIQRLVKDRGEARSPEQLRQLFALDLVAIEHEHGGRCAVDVDLVHEIPNQVAGAKK